MTYFWKQKAHLCHVSGNRPAFRRGNGLPCPLVYHDVRSLVSGRPPCKGILLACITCSKLSECTDTCRLLYFSIKPRLQTLSPRPGGRVLCQALFRLGPSSRVLSVPGNIEGCCSDLNAQGETVPSFVNLAPAILFNVPKVGMGKQSGNWQNSFQNLESGSSSFWGSARAQGTSFIVKFPYNARSDWLKQRTLSENRKRVNDIKLPSTNLTQIKHPLYESDKININELSFSSKYG